MQTLERPKSGFSIPDYMVGGYERTGLESGVFDIMFPEWRAIDACVHGAYFLISTFPCLDLLRVPLFETSNKNLYCPANIACVLGLGAHFQTH